MVILERGREVLNLRFLRFVAALSLLLFIIPLTIANGAGLKGKLSGGVHAASNNTAPNRSVLPKRGDIAVVVDGSDVQHVKTAEASIIEMLISHGYRVVDETKMKKIRAAAARAKAARFALEGNVEGILRISSGYSAAATVVAHVQAGKPVQNEFQLYTCTSSVALMAVTSNGTKLGGKTAQGKQVGYTEDEAQQKAIDSAVASGMAQMF